MFGGIPNTSDKATPSIDVCGNFHKFTIRCLSSVSDHSYTVVGCEIEAPERAVCPQEVSSSCLQGLGPYVSRPWCWLICSEDWYQEYWWG